MGDYLQAAKHSAKMQLALQKEVGKQNKAEMEYNAKEAATAREWQKMMSDTSHQRETKDLMAAGLNPVLSANGGAQSYTTSSASANLENAAGEMANVYSSAVGAQATQNAASTSAAAMKRSAQISAAAQQYAANRQAAAQEYAALMNYKGGVYKANLDYKARKYGVDNSKSGSVPGIVDNYLKKAHLDLSQKELKAIKQDASVMSKNPQKYKVIPDQKASNSNMTHEAKVLANSFLKKYGVKSTPEYRTVYARAFIEGDPSALRTVTRWISDYKKRNEKASQNWQNRVGSGVW